MLPLVSSRYILVIDDDPMVAPQVEAATRTRVVAARSLAEVEGKAAGLRPLALFVDIDLYGDSSLSKLPLLRSWFPHSPILVISSTKDMRLVAEALAKGADDFIRKPFDDVEVMARLEVRLANRQRLRDMTRLQFRSLDLDRREARICGPEVCAQLSPKDALLLATLIDAKGTCVSRQRLESLVWGSTSVSRNSLDKKIQLLRRVLKGLGTEVTINSKYGSGYSLGVRDESDHAPEN